MFVHGEPALLLTSREREWRDRIRATGIVGMRRIGLRFVVGAWRRRGHRFDLDNLITPVLSVIAAGPPEREFVWATVEVGPEPGVLIHDDPPPRPPPPAVLLAIARPPRKSVRTSIALPELASAVLLGEDEPIGCMLALGADCGSLTFGFDGPVKPMLDALWPVLGGSPHNPADHRIRDLRVLVDTAASGAVVSLWTL